ncbi:aldehyde dehydrogenase [Streptomyces albidoflavus]|nr:aldehyde dehydrogenase [Streptomyces albidoflavus]
MPEPQAHTHKPTAEQAAAPVLPGGAYIEGRWEAVATPLEVMDPESGRIVSVVSRSGAAEVTRAVDYLVREHPRTNWPLWQRRVALAKAAALVEQRAPHFESILTAESIKRASDARGEVQRAAATLRLAAEAASHLEGGTVPFGNDRRGEGWTGWYTREPLGVVAAITPYNDPLNLVAHKLGPGLLAGNAMVLKPSELTPLSAFALVEVLLEAGVPKSHLAVFAGVEAAKALVADPRIDAISFTGGRSTADLIAAEGRARKLLMDLGGNNALIALADADADEVASSVVEGAFSVAGQSCLSVQRVLVAAPLYEAVLERVVALASSLHVGSKYEAGTDVGPMINEQTAARVMDMVSSAVAEGASLRTGGRHQGAFAEPTVLTGVSHESDVWRHEVFGPVVVLEPWEDLSCAIDAANGVDTGLQAGVFTRDIDQALNLAERLRVGAVLINSNSDFRIDAMPFGGFKSSGIGREGVPSAVEALSEPKVVAIHRSSTL